MNRYGREVDYGDGSSLHYHGRGVQEETTHEGGGSTRRGGFFAIFRNNPSLMIILIDIIVIVLVLTIVLPFIGTKSSTSDFAGLELSLHGFLHEGKATVSLVITSLPGEGEAAAAAHQDLLTVRFEVAGGEIQEGEEVEETVRVNLPETGESLVLRKTLELPEAKTAEYVSAEIERMQEKLTLTKELSK
jgi:hypothetical protein